MSKSHEDYLKQKRIGIWINNVAIILLGILIFLGAMTIVAVDPACENPDSKTGLMALVLIGLFGIVWLTVLNMCIEGKYLRRRQETLMRILFYECPAWKDDFENPYFWEDDEDNGSEKNEDNNDTS